MTLERNPDRIRQQPGNDNPLMFWAKLAGRSGPGFHPLLYHMIDVAAVAKAIWENVLPVTTQRSIGADLGLDKAAAGRWITFWAGLHDLGKASPAFQGRDPAARERVQAAGLSCSRRVESPHGTISTRSLQDLLQRAEFGGSSGEIAHRVAVVVGGHHGVFPRTREVDRLSRDAHGGQRWEEARLDLARLVERTYPIPDITPSRLDNATALWLAGFVSVADWIGSSEDHFPYAVADPARLPLLDLEGYQETAAAHAKDALDQLGWTARPSAAPITTGFRFRDLFPQITAPSPVQEAVAELAEELTGPRLVIIEAPMGEGKTEAALYLADRWRAETGGFGCYLALPTRATSDQMFGRLRDFLTQQFDSELVNLQLLHGHAALSGEFAWLKAEGKRLLEPRGVEGSKGYDGAAAGVVAAEWFTHRKRGLLAPFGVGTVDQVLLAALQTRHMFVRLYGLAHKTVIIDEVHAYDAYMSTLLERLLNWLGALGCQVILLSATLPRERRQVLADAYAKGINTPPRPIGTTTYPRVAWVSADQTGERQVVASELGRKTVRVRWLPASADDETADRALGARLKETLAGGGCAAVICTTVRRAQEVYLRLKDDPFFQQDADDGQPMLDLLHAQYLYEDREVRERRVLSRFGKEGTKVGTSVDAVDVRRPARAVLVATQVIEQSLDLDFDLMVTDLAPVDLVLQRLGRLHRHRERDSMRPEGMREPTVWLRQPTQDEDHLPRFGSATTYVYEEHVLLRSWLALRDRHDKTIAIPDDVEALIEAVYDDARPCPTEADEAVCRQWNDTQQQLQASRNRDKARAKEVCILPPYHPDDLFEDHNLQLDEDHPEVQVSLQALTRLTEQTVSVVCLTPEQEAAGSSPAGRTPKSPSIKDFEAGHAAGVLVSVNLVTIWSRARADTGVPEQHSTIQASIAGLAAPVKQCRRRT